MTAALVEDAYRLTEQARAYVITGDPSHIIAYRREKAALRSVEQRITHLRDQGTSISELAALQQGLHWADALTDEQEAAIDAAEKGDRETARAIVFGDENEIGRAHV